MRTLPIIAVNGVVDAQISPLDRGFNYGDGVFETCRLLKSKIPLWEFHKERLLNSCTKLQIPVDANLIESQLNNLISTFGHTLQATVKVTVTRGQGGRGYAIAENITPTVVIGIFPLVSYPDSYFSEGIIVRVCSQRLSRNPDLAGLKHLNRLEQILARAEWSDETIAEGLVCDTNNRLVEAVFSNVFFVKHDELFTPDLSESGVAGVMRRIIIDKIAPAFGIKSNVGQYTLLDLKKADEIFLCNSNYGIWPVRKILTEQPQFFSLGEVTKKLQTYLNNTFFS